MCVACMFTSLYDLVIPQTSSQSTHCNTGIAPAASQLSSRPAAAGRLITCLSVNMRLPLECSCIVPKKSSAVSFTLPSVPKVNLHLLCVTMSQVILTLRILNLIQLTCFYAVLHAFVLLAFASVKVIKTALTQAQLQSFLIIVLAQSECESQED